MVAICKKCRHIKIETDDSIWYNYRCKKGGQKYEYNYVLGVDEKVGYPYCRDLNSNGRCLDFKKKLLAKKDKPEDKTELSKKEIKKTTLDAFLNKIK